MEAGSTSDLEQALSDETSDEDQTALRIQQRAEIGRSQLLVVLHVHQRGPQPRRDPHFPVAEQHPETVAVRDDHEHRARASAYSCVVVE